MRQTLCSVNIKSLVNVLLSLRYRECGKDEYRKGKFHVILHPKEKTNRIELHMHVDKKYYGPPLFEHRSRRVGKDISQEYRNIIRALRKET